jgi:hypothetical protein
MGQSARKVRQEASIGEQQCFIIEVPQAVPASDGQHTGLEAKGN